MALILAIWRPHPKLDAQEAEAHVPDLPEVARRLVHEKFAPKLNRVLRRVATRQRS